jgi:hypothetical protein
MSVDVPRENTYPENHTINTARDAGHSAQKISLLNFDYEPRDNNYIDR